MAVIRFAIVLAACAPATEFPAARFRNAAPVTAVDDHRDTPDRPEVYRDLQTFEFYDAAIERPITRALELPRDRRALGVNALDEVPDSTWFTNRIGARELTPDEIRNGPLTIESPELHRPWTVHSTKLGGPAYAGLIITDARGVKYMVKFERPGYPELETGTHVVVNRLLWACGYHVAEDEVVYFRASDLSIAPDAKVKDRQGNTTGRLGRDELATALAAVVHEPDGQIRALASRWLDGKPLGGHPPEGTRAGDRNDRIPHELRRDLRGASPILAWLDHTEMTRSNTLDMWVERGGRHYVEHYLMDFGVALGVKAVERRDLHSGWMYEVDYATLARELVSAGVDDRPWGQRFAPALRGVAPAFVADFDPGTWHSDQPYAPFVASDRFDKLWGAMIVARFTRAQIRAAVEAGRFSDPRAIDYLTDTLLARARATTAYWFSRVAPLDHFAIAHGALCFEDLAPGPGTHYIVAMFDAGGRVLEPAADSASRCIPISASSYAILQITTLRAGFRGTTYVHIASDPRTHTPRVIGVWRD